MPTLISPQVFTQEIDMTVYNAASTGPKAAIVLRHSYKGREEDTIVVTSENEFVSKFGKPSSDLYTQNYNYVDMFSAIAFLKDSNQLYCTRVLPVSATFAGTAVTSGGIVGPSATFVGFTYENAPILSAGSGQVEDPDDYPDSLHAAGISTEIMYIISKDRGHCGNNLRVAMCDKDTHDAIRNKEYSAWDTYSALYNVDAPLESAKEFILVVQECAQGTDTSTESNWTTVEWWNVSTTELKMSDLGENMYVESAINTGSQYIRVAFNDLYNNAELTSLATPEWQVLTGGRINNTATTLANAGTVLKTDITDAQLTAAYDLCSNSETTEMDLLIDSDKPIAVKAHIISIAAARKDCMAIIDCPYTDVINNVGSEEADLRDWINGASGLYALYPDAKSSYGVTYGNWLDIYDKYNSKYRWVPASGYAAAIFAKCQRDYQYWDAPAGLNRGSLSGVRRLAWNPTLAQRDGIYKYNINPIVSFSGQGKVLYGQKTLLDKYSAFNRVNVRRLFISVESDIGVVARKYLFEPNNENTRNAFVSDVRPILEDAKNNDGINAYKIVCDATNNSDDRVLRNELWMEIYIQPVFTAEYIIITFIATKSTADFTEAVATTV